MAKEFHLSGESGTLYNGAEDTDGGIWLRIRDENDRRILGAAIDKQKKAQQAATGTLLALDPNAGHLVDYVGSALDRLLESINGARPSAAQLDGTPMGAALAVDAGDGKGKGKGKGKGGKPSTVGEVLAAVPGSPLAPTDAAGGIQWADNVPEPRPAVGDPIRTSNGGQLSVERVVGFDGESRAFRVFDATGWDGLVYHHAPSNEWRILSQTLDYPADAPAATEPSTINAAGIVAGVTTADAIAAKEPDAGEPYASEPAAAEPVKGAKRAAKKAAATPPAKPEQRARNAKNVGLTKTPSPRPVGKKKK